MIPEFFSLVHICRIRRTKVHQNSFFSTRRTYQIWPNLIFKELDISFNKPYYEITAKYSYFPEARDNLDTTQTYLG